MAGYSGTPLAKKLGIKAGHRVVLIGAPDKFEQILAPLPEGVQLRRDLRGSAACDVMLFFSKRLAELIRRFPGLKKRLQKDGGLWICWPKKASGVATDLGDAEVRRTGLDGGLVDNKVCAVDETWSGLRFVYRRENR